MIPSRSARPRARLLLFSLLCSSGLAACSAPATRASEPAAVVAVPAPLANRLTEHVRWLADDAREGRRAGTEPARIAAHWIAEQLAQVGLERAGEKGGWFQEFQVGLEPRDGGESVVSVITDVEGIALHAVPLFCAEGGAVNAKAVFCGYGIEDSERGWDDFAGKDLKGRIALVVRGTPPAPAGSAAGSKPVAVQNPHGSGEQVAAQNPHGSGETQLVAAGDGWGSGGSVFTKVMNAKRHGAVGVVLLPRSESEGVLAFDAGHGARAGIPCATLAWADAQRLALHAMGLEQWVLATPAPPSGPSQNDVIVSADVRREQGPALNVLGLLRGRDSTRCVVIGAHYDHLGRGGQGSLAPGDTESIHNGADDNASGTAAVIEIARALKVRGAPGCDVLFALWSGEELGLLGSEYWAQHPTLPFDRVTANLNLDMVGRAGSGALQVLGAGTSSAFAPWMDGAGAASGLDLTVSLSGQALGGSSDHQTFLKRGVPALHLFSGLHADYHKPTDDTDKFEAAGTARVVVLGVELVQRMSAAAELDFVEFKAPAGERKAASGGFKVRLGSIPNYAYDGIGVLIDGASQGTPAERAGLIRGDVLLRIGDVKLENVYDLTYALGHFKPGDVVVVRFRRDGAEQETRVTLAAPSGEVR